MTAKRTPDFSLARAVRAASFTPRAKDLAGLFSLLDEGDEDLITDVERAIVRLGGAAVAPLEARLRDAAPPLGERLTRVLGRLAATDEGARPGLLALLQASEPRTRRTAAIAAGKLRGPAIEKALLAAWEREDRPENRRSLAEALGKAGGARALARLEEVSATDDDALERALGRARLMLGRSLGRGVASSIDPERRPPSPVPIVLTCRAGLAPLLVDELGPTFRPRIVAPDRVEARLLGPLSEIFRARTMLRVGFVLPEGGGDTGAAVVRALTSPEAMRIFETWTVGPIRYRLAWASGGHRRALGWKCAQEIAARAPALVNDPTATTWEAVVTEDGPVVRVELVPRRLPDPRFTYRQGDVPAASHPTLAAALAHLAGARPDDVVWDPFVGSGLELIERARLGPWQSMHGSDVDRRALQVARQNLKAAGVRGVNLVAADGTVHRVPDVTLVITNPPMGRRVARGDVGELIDRFVDHVGRSLREGGRFVWISPLGRRTAARARKAGLVLASAQDVDMGGFTGQMQAFRKA